jgi:ABC-type dipeptide/oligopeptide/nickel transport system permease subunit
VRPGGTVEMQAELAIPREWPRREGYWPRFWRRFARNRLAVVGLVVVAVTFGVGIFAPWVAPHSYREQNWDMVEQPPSWTYLLGTDELGRDQLSRLVWGARTAIIVAPTVTLLWTILGVMMGALAGYLGGRVEMVIMRLADIFFAFPGLLFAMLISATVQPRIEAWLKGIAPLSDFVRAGYVEFFVVIFALSLVGWGGMARLVRGQFLSLKEEEFVLAAQAIGVPTWRIIWRHILPNALVPILVFISMGMGGAITAEATLSFLGIGIQPPTPSWGAMIFDNYAFWRRPFSVAFRLLWLPGFIIALMRFAFNFLGDGLNEALSPGR